MNERSIEATTVRDSYYPGYIYRNDTITFNAGSEVYVLDAPDGEAFVMQSFTRHWDPTLSEDNRSGRHDTHGWPDLAKHSDVRSPGQLVATSG